MQIHLIQSQYSFCHNTEFSLIVLLSSTTKTPHESSSITSKWHLCFLPTFGALTSLGFGNLAQKAPPRPWAVKGGCLALISSTPAHEDAPPELVLRPPGAVTRHLGLPRLRSGSAALEQGGLRTETSTGAGHRCWRQGSECASPPSSEPGQAIHQLLGFFLSGNDSSCPKGSLCGRSEFIHMNKAREEPWSQYLGSRLQERGKC